jgi:nitrate/TMAO reductase-like tetraheme cytochrome c subunit
MPSPQVLLFGLIALSAVLALVMFLRPGITASRGGKMLAFLCLLVIPGMSLSLGTVAHVEKSKSTEFCLSCHIMEPYGKSLHVDDTSSLPAQHYQNNRVPREEACFTCHQDYVMYGTALAKIRGLRHVYAQYVQHKQPPLHLYKPYNNRECLHCHLGSRTFEEGAMHNADPDLMPQIKSNQKSCLDSGCHDTVHKLKDEKLWKEPGK